MNNNLCKFKNLAVFIECASNAVPNVQTLKKFAKLISQMGYNRIYLGTADTYKIEDEKYFGYMRGGYTKSEIKELDEFCKGVNIELTPAIQSLAHLQFMQNYYEYQDIIDTGSILLVDEERTYVFVEKMFKAMSEAYSSRTIHIGMDEAFFLGLGKYLKKHGYTDRMQLMMRHLNRTAQIAKKYGFTCQMWSDMFYHLVTGERYADVEISDEVKKLVPDGLELVYWNYLNEDTDRCDAVIKSHLKITKNVAYAGAIWKFIGFAPDNAFSMKICKPAMDACQNNGINSFIVTLWADNGSEASLFSALPGLYYYGEYAYGNVDGERALDEEKFKRITGVNFKDFMLLDILNKPDFRKEYKNLNNKCFTFLYNDLLMGTFDSLISDGLGAKYEECSGVLKNVEKNDFSYIFENLKNLADVLSVKAELSKRIRRAYSEKDSNTLFSIVNLDIPKYIGYLNVFFETFKSQWLRENKSFGFETQCARIGALIKRAEFTASFISDYLNKKIERIDVLEEEQMPFGYDKQASEDSYILMTWSKIVSHGFI